MLTSSKSYLVVLNFIVFNLFFTHMISGQCPELDVYLRTQEQVDSFKINYPNCNHLKHNLNIGGFESDINDLGVFEDLITIEGDLNIEINSELKVINGFNNLEVVDGFLRITQNKVLTDLAGFSNLKEVEFLTIDRNTELDSFRLFPELTKIEWVFSLQTLQDVFSFEGDNILDVDLVSFVGNVVFDLSDNMNSALSITIESNANYKSLGSLIERLPTFTNSLSIVNLDEFNFNSSVLLDSIEKISLVELDELNFENNISFKNEIELSIKNCSGFESLDMLSNYSLKRLNLNNIEDLKNISLVEVNSWKYLTTLVVQNCKYLESLSGFESAPLFVSGGFVNNERLSHCSILPVCNGIEENPGAFIISDNLGKCETLESVVKQCTLTGIQELNFSDIETKFKITNEFIYLNFNTFQYPIKRIDVLNAMGAVVLKSHLQIEDRINIASLTSGIYYLNVLFENGSFSFSFNKN